MCDKNIIVNILEITSHMAHLRVKTLWKLEIQAKQYEKICDFKKKIVIFLGGGGVKRGEDVVNIELVTISQLRKW